MRIAIINYGLGNLFSVLGAVRKVGYDAIITNDLYEIASADKLILPGVGAFGDGINNMKNLGLIKPLDILVNKKKKPILAICLGFQLLSKESYEFGFHKGLGWVDASVKKLETKNKKMRIPHVGWNDLLQNKDSILWEGIADNALVYYVHSYHMQCTNENIIIGRCKYGDELVAAIEYENIYGTQFHPEKSQFFGLKILKNFIEKS